MSQALALAEQARPICPPNPAVGCVLVGADGQVIGQGHTQPTGQAHAEVMALRDAQARGHSTAGATAYVTLEPCAHQGRTGPCADALIAAGVRRVVASLQDPNPRVAGQGLARLRAAGVEVEIGPGAEVARELNIGFFSRMTRGRPWVRMKVAASLDGRTALPNGASQWITSDAARADGHTWRARACAVLTGIGTVLRDDPRLDVRLPGTTRQPMLVIADSQWRTPLAARLWQVPGRRVCIVGAGADAGREQPLRVRGADVLQQAGADGRIDLPALLAELARREVNEVHVEAGAQLNAALWRAGLVDELLLYQAPRLLGEGAPLAALGPFTELAEGPRLEYIGVDRIGPDLRVRARVIGR
ncbi:MAG: bifunctional diaminohydroxyphosphoribosylaminopyrimidine deaminase/5-amino-6-(5-phosphoribosylamino)uracil reductase RibD [Burkholderiales bacterium]|uniref:bifunctional diaminohydroxyphosphoribosylaminopyrimidine deaminase/5-amino-6-(5-phosphoribosylamino)uracil reductase RibD n=1 Tax=Ottowia sp. TaxID=1898956 RepID=UPI001ACCE1CD|nr:bifunctional diaminohydroxyphosphoribosylaminopyrimidine deaminase/5-amino-6-(5-phosphoribosylamino)uracil reductase RibD [Ottowia sp.]MBN9404400.1 bifunctional diaminohydroxyphosphoribosylaminopyrimidine deaminase/5-amino-6-(5-phosphoribosylamino)uracil reductase RibD [Burkholderiales bacterium]MBS0403711.1 bifunctional diaminohydroxyphosphoribosylaminopyrimidine deaminase/5-amino-6-(5-phosphoribosylamino)uracil reductase RibD [Pseudomonadota bacterium]MBS0412915.1 bifunctional diaminohydrox